MPAQTLATAFGTSYVGLLEDIDCKTLAVSDTFPTLLDTIPTANVNVLPSLKLFVASSSPVATVPKRSNKLLFAVLFMSFIS